MGEILHLTCSCGYEAEDLFVGCGLAGHDWQRDLAVCSHCGEVVTIRATKRRTCPICRHAVVVVELPVMAGGSGEDRSVLLDTPCPKCGQESMRVTETGVWD